MLGGGRETAHAHILDHAGALRAYGVLSEVSCLEVGVLAPLILKTKPAVIGTHQLVSIS